MAKKKRANKNSKRNSDRFLAYYLGGELLGGRNSFDNGDKISVEIPYTFYSPKSNYLSSILENNSMKYLYDFEKIKELIRSPKQRSFCPTTKS